MAAPASTRQADAVTQAFAEFSAQVVWDRLPAATQTMAKHELLDFLGDMIGGRAVMGMPPWLAVICDAGGRGEASIVGGPRAPARDAALANGYFGHVLELDDTHDVAVLHAGASTIPAALACAERRGGVSGKVFLEAIVYGIEITCRLGVATRLNLVEGGWIYSSLLGHFGAAAAAARVLGCDTQQLRNALGGAYCLTCGNHESTREGAPTKHLQPAFAAQNGVMAALMASQGLPAVAQPFTGEDGLDRVYLSSRFDAAQAIEGLGTRFEVARLSFKPYPSCRLTHPAISAALELHRRLGARAAEATGVHLAIGPQAHDVVGRDEPARRHPVQQVAAQFSVYWCVACVLVHGELSPRQLLDEIPPSPRVAAMIARIHCESDGATDTRDVGGCTLTVTGAFGTQEASVTSAKGHPDNPLTEEEVIAKFLVNVRLAGIEEQAGRDLARDILAIDTLPDVAGLAVRLGAIKTK